MLKAAVLGCFYDRDVYQVVRLTQLPSYLD